MFCLEYDDHSPIFTFQGVRFIYFEGDLMVPLGDLNKEPSASLKIRGEEVITGWKYSFEVGFYYFSTQYKTSDRVCGEFIMDPYQPDEIQIKRLKLFEELFADDEIEIDNEHLTQWVHNVFESDNWKVEIGGPQRRVYFYRVQENAKHVATMEDFVRDCVLTYPGQSFGESIKCHTIFDGSMNSPSNKPLQY